MICERDNMKQEILTIMENVPVTGSVYRMRLEGAELEAQKPGGFVNIRLDGLFLRRPISVFDSAPGSLTILYKVVGKGTEQMNGMKAGETLDVLTGLGNGYDLAKAGDHPLLLGGGVGLEAVDHLRVTLGYDYGLLDRDTSSSITLHRSNLKLAVYYMF